MSTSQITCSHVAPLKQNNDDILRREPAEVVDMALGKLQTAGIVMLEWLALLYRRMNVPVIIKNYSYLVPDEQLDKASALLSSMGLPLSPHSTLLLMTDGDFHAKARLHRITIWTLPSSVQHLALYPQSFSTLDDSELEEMPPSHLSTTSSLCKSIRVPSPPAVYASIFRLLLRYPKHCATTTVLLSDLSELIGYDLLGLEDGYLDPYDKEALAAVGLNQRLKHGAKIVLQWGIDGAWRPGEEWIGDALAAVVAGTGDLECLPLKDE
ncbi:hypothetical protein F5887DRAFT_1006143 [Amanita rubescens]|nr:hypothetical protein F5887DRAFT_1006143 [Amanita rubescens]